MTTSKVTVVIATYNRPDVLRVAIDSVVNQTITTWKLLVIGDNCDNRTGKLMSTYNDERIRYINLSERFGEQSGPNSVGLALADTSFIAYLNHDDVWLPDHLESGIEILAQNNYDFYISGTAFSNFAAEKDNQLKVYVNDINATRNRQIFNAYTRYQVGDYEPVSSWIFTSKVAAALKKWNFYKSIYRPPIEDFLLRAWKMNFKFYFSRKITTWHLLMHYRNTNSHFYNYKGNEHDVVESIVKANTPDVSRRIITNEFNQWTTLSKSEKESLYEMFYWRSRHLNKKNKIKKLLKLGLLNWFSAHLYKSFNIDLYIIFCMVTNKKKGFMLKNVMKKRTLEVKNTPDIDRVLDSITINNNASYSQRGNFSR